MHERSGQLDLVQTLLFYPRGGSAQVIRYLAAALDGQQVDCRIVSGSCGEPGDATHAGTFFDGLTVEPVDYGPALDAAECGKDPLLEPVPLHPSYEDREAVPDRIFTAVDPETADHLEDRWAEILRSRVQTIPDLFHVHHLSPLQAAVRANWPDAPMIGHIHGTELKLLTGISSRLRIAEQLGLDPESDADKIADTVTAQLHHLDPADQRVAAGTRWHVWRYARFWQERLQQYAAMCDRLIVLTEDGRNQVVELVGYDADRIYPVPNGVDTDHFTPAELSTSDRLARWRHWLVEDPQGWDESGVPGSVRYSPADIDEWFVEASGEHTPVLFYVGRFTGMKRVPMLIRAYKRAQPNFKWRAPLVIWGGNPGEWEYEHPVTVAREEGVPGVFFVGWRGHDELPLGLNASDVMVAPSTNEPFGQVYLEAMACQIPVIATLSGGPPSFINRQAEGPDGWLIPPDDEAALAEALVEAVNDPEERERRGRNALRSVRSAYSWNQVAGTVREIYNLAIQDHGK